jgi:hypothetical protein
MGTSFCNSKANFVEVVHGNYVNVYFKHNCVTILVFLTGGGSESVFSPIYFIVPALAIFLREPLGRVITYLIVVSLAFTITLLRVDITESRIAPSLRINRLDDSKGYADKIALWFVSISCFTFATYIGYITRA